MYSFGRILLSPSRLGIKRIRPRCFGDIFPLLNPLGWGAHSKSENTINTFGLENDNEEKYANEGMVQISEEYGNDHSVNQTGSEAQMDVGSLSV